MKLRFFSTALWVLISLSSILLSGVKEALIKEEFVFSNPPFQSCHASTIVETPSGDLLCAFFAGSCEGADDIEIWMSRFPKSGTKWTEPAVVARQSEASCWNPVLFTTSMGEVLLFYKVGKSPREWTGCLKRSTNNGFKWSITEILPAGVYGPVRNKPLELSNKTLLCGSSTESFRKWDCWMDMTTDFGKTWFKSQPIVSGQTLWGIIQPTLFYTKDGHIKMLARSKDRKKIMQATTQDQGLTWSKVEPTTLPNPNAAIDSINLQDGSVLLAYNHSTENRYPLNISTSADDGTTWNMKGALETNKGEYSYPAVIMTKDGLVHITYTWNRSSIKHVVLDPSKL